MASVPPPSIKMRCPAVAGLGAAELSTSTVPTPDLRGERGRLGCELVAGHDGTHVALAATARDDDQWWWLRWEERLHEVIQIDPCAAELAHGPYRDCCTLPDGHAGPHSFDLAALPPSLEGAAAWRHAGPASAVDSVRRGGLAVLQNPGNRACACLPDCWCKRTKIGYALRWYTPGQWHRLPDPSSYAGLQRCQ